MTERYESTRSRGGASLMLIFPEGNWERLPFEIRLLHPWHGSEFLDRTSLTARQCLDIAGRGYSLADAKPTTISEKIPEFIAENCSLSDRLDAPRC
jgi:hypothetical protein